MWMYMCMLQRRSERIVQSRRYDYLSREASIQSFFTGVTPTVTSTVPPMVTPIVTPMVFPTVTHIVYAMVTPIVTPRLTRTPYSSKTELKIPDKHFNSAKVM